VKDQTGWTVLDAVDELTLPQKHRVTSGIVRNGQLVGQHEITATEQPLLTKLVEAIRGTIGADGPSKATLDSERSPLDADALFRFVLIDNQIRDWCRGLKLTPGPDPVQNLRSWYVESMKYPQSEAADTFHIRKMTDWAGAIRSKIDPGREWELPDRCPVCDADTWWRDGEQFYRPLIIKYRPDGADTIEKARGLCRACAKVWKVRELAYAIEVREGRHAATSTLTMDGLDTA